MPSPCPTVWAELRQGPISKGSKWIIDSKQGLTTCWCYVQNVLQKTISVSAAPCCPESVLSNSTLIVRYVRCCLLQLIMSFGAYDQGLPWFAIPYHLPPFPLWASSVRQWLHLSSRKIDFYTPSITIVTWFCSWTWWSCWKPVHIITYLHICHTHHWWEQHFGPRTTYSWNLLMLHEVHNVPLCGLCNNSVRQAHSRDPSLGKGSNKKNWTNV